MRHHPSWQVLTLLGLVALGSTSFFVIFRARLAAVPAASYEARDDAVITLSHARNLVDFGFIGVSPSGERVEGFSAPLQFWVAAAAFAIARVHYGTFLAWQTWIGTVTLGAIVAGLLLFPAPLGKARWRYGFIVVALLASAQILASSRAFLLWHASGMENVYKSVALVGLLWALDGMLRTARIQWLSVGLVSLAALTRVDAIVPVSLLLTAFVLMWWVRYRDRRALIFTATSLVPWLLFMMWRRWYFGQWEPNTAVAQGISMSTRVAALLQAPGVVVADSAEWFADVGKSLHAFQLAWLPIVALLGHRCPAALNRSALIVAGVLGVGMQYALFGPARLDIARTATELALYATVAVPFVLLARGEFRAQDFTAGVLILACSLAVVGIMPQDRAEVGWGAALFEGTASQFEEIAREQDLPRLTAATPDLGAVSWNKRVNVIDLGLLGSSVMPRLAQPGSYVSGFARADVIEVHDGWSCQYRDLFTNRAFVDEYAPVTAGRTDWIAAHCPDVPGAMSGVWIRRAVMKDSGSAERAFLDVFRLTLSTRTLDDELSRCLGGPGPRPCAHVGRTVYRFVPELKRAGRYEAIAARLARDARLRIEHAYFTSSSDPHWWRTVVATVQPLSVSPERLSVFTLVDGTRSSRATVTLVDALHLGWRVAPPADLVEVRPAQGVGSAVLTLVARRVTGELDRTLEIPVFSGNESAPVKTLTVRFRAVGTAGSGPPTGFMDVPPDPVKLGEEPVAFQGWALDPFDLRGVFVAYVDAAGKTVTIGEARRSGTRTDVAALFPNAHDLFNSGWAYTLTPRALRGVPRPVTLYFYARGATSETSIGVRTILAK